MLKTIDPLLNGQLLAILDDNATAGPVLGRDGP
jgi:L-fucose mutarotase/ribose pyranase (RbsD/FucU family)